MARQSSEAPQGHRSAKTLILPVLVFDMKLPIQSPSILRDRGLAFVQQRCVIRRIARLPTQLVLKPILPLDAVSLQGLVLEASAEYLSHSLRSIPVISTEGQLSAPEADSSVRCPAVVPDRQHHRDRLQCLSRGRPRIQLFRCIDIVNPQPFPCAVLAPADAARPRPLQNRKTKSLLRRSRVEVAAKTKGRCCAVLLEV